MVEANIQANRIRTLNQNKISIGTVYYNDTLFLGAKVQELKYNADAKYKIQIQLYY